MYFTAEDFKEFKLLSKKNYTDNTSINSNTCKCL